MNRVCRSVTLLVCLTTRVASSKNIRLHYVDNGRKDKPLMLMVHGYPEFWYSWRHQLREFGKDYRVVAIDIRGYGESGKPSGILHYTREQLVADIRQFVEFLGYKQIILIGNDLGGIISILFATRYPQFVEKLVVCNAPHPFAVRKLMATSITQLRKFWYAFMYQWPVLPILWIRQADLQYIEELLTGPDGGAKPGSISQQEVEAYKYTFQNYADLTGPVNFYRASLRYPANEDMYRGRVTMPTLVIWGTNDLALQPELAEMSLQYLDKGILRTIEGGSHWIQQEEPEIVNNYIRLFLTAPGKL